MYIQIIASSGTPTYLYGFQLKSENGEKALNLDGVPCGVAQSIQGTGKYNTYMRGVT